MDVRILDLDGALDGQLPWLAEWSPRPIPARDWGPRIRLACSFRRFEQFGQQIAPALRAATSDSPAVTFCGSGDFHHVSLALIRRLSAPVNLLVLDNHPDWMRGVPFLHCGTWLWHAVRLPQIARIFHVGGDVDFDNYYRPLAPWPFLRSGKIVVFPAIRRFRGTSWQRVPHQALRRTPAEPICAGRLASLLLPFREELAARPLYISLDKDVMTAQEAIVNWDSGHLHFGEVQTVIAGFLEAARHRLAGADILGDWSPVTVGGTLRRVMHWSMHPSLTVDPEQAAGQNGAMNARLLALLARATQCHRAA